MNEKEITDIFERTGAILKGHFQLASGLHTNTYIQCSRVTEWPAEMEKLCRELAQKWNGQEIDVVVGPAYGGILPAYELARHVQARSVFCERGKDGSFELRRGFQVQENNVLVTEDVITTGGSAKEAVDLVKASGGTVVGVASFVDRGVDKKFSEDHRFLLSITPPTWTPEECPACKAGEIAIKPGQTMQSMTGYGSAQKRNGNFHIEIEVRSVNHRFINLKQNLPDGLVRHENEIDKLLRQKVYRGSVTVLVTLKPIHHRTQNLPDGKTIKTFVQHLRKIQKEAGIEGEIKMNALLTFPHLWNNSGHDEKEAASWPATKQLLIEAFENLAKMRSKEGSGIKKDLEGRLKRIEKLASLIGKRTGGVLTRYENRLESRIQNLLKNKGFDIAKPDILREVAVHADKCDISEELQRLQSHIKQFRSIMKTGGQMGRKLDFLNQEMVRETTTMTAKGNDAKISNSAVNIKAELEKIKEQVENIE